MTAGGDEPGPVLPATDWIGRSRVAEDVLSGGMAEGLAATLDAEPPAAGGAAPQGCHWLLAPERAPMAGLGSDGHPARGDFMPPIDLPRRMWVGSEITFINPLRIGDRVTRRSEIAAVTPKSGASGALVFVDVEHRYQSREVDCVRERQTLVYRPGGSAAPRRGEPASAGDFERRCTPDPVMLFRYSALTFNGHRIHYDYPYATEVENYPGLVVQAPLMASLLLDLCTRRFGQNCLASFAFRAERPAYAGNELALRGSGDAALALTASALGEVCLRAEARLR